MKLSDLGVQFGDFELCVMHFKLGYIVGAYEVPYPMVVEDRPIDPLEHATAMIYRAHIPLTEHMTTKQNLVSFNHLPERDRYLCTGGA